MIRARIFWYREEATSMGVFHDDLLFKVTNYAARRFRQQLIDRPERTEQLRDRGIAPGVIRDFEIGYATPEWRSLTKSLEGEREYLLDCAQTVGLVARGRRGLRDRFRNRYVLPLRDREGSVAGFSTVLAHALEDSFRPKPHDMVRMNSSHSPIFDKRNYVLGGSQVLDKTGVPEKLLVARGTVETLRFHSRGHHNVVSTLLPGALTLASDDSQSRLLYEGADRVLEVQHSNAPDDTRPVE